MGHADLLVTPALPLRIETERLVLHKLAFVDTGHDELDTDYGDSMVATTTLTSWGR